MDQGERRDGPDVSAEALDLVAAMTQLGPSYMRWVEDQLVDAGVSWPRLRLMRALQQAGRPMIMSALGEQLGITGRAVTQLVDALEAEGLVARLPHPDDRRATVVRMTAGGQALAVRTIDQHAEAVATLFDDLTTHDRRELLRLLGRLQAALRSRVGPPPPARVRRSRARDDATPPATPADPTD